MRSNKVTGRIVGLLLLIHLITGLTTPYIILRPLSAPLTFAANNPTNSLMVRLSVMLLFIGGAVTIAIAVTAWPVFRQYNYALAFWIVALAVVNFSLQCVENAAWMSLFTLSRDYAGAAPADVSIYNVVGAAVRSAWKWVHYTHLLIVVSWMLLLCATLWRMALVPRVLAALGVVATLMQITGITLPQFLAYPSPMALAMGLPLGVVYLTLSGWLMVKGFRGDIQEGMK
ncbi:MAG TPA: DUF4386 domain-containing protein [Pyrinomonadaceae bacterium]